MTRVGQRLAELRERDPGALEGLEDPHERHGHRCSARFPYGREGRTHRVAGVYLGTFEDSPEEVGGTGRPMIRFLGDDGQVWETRTLETIGGRHVLEDE